MMRRYLKAAAGMVALLISCDNPFANNLGAKVDIEYPSITVYGAEQGFPPPGGFVQGVASFSGSAKAYRELRRVEVSIAAPAEYDEQEPPPLLPWTDITKLDANTMTSGTLSGGAQEKIWTFTLDTRAFPRAVKNENGENIIKRGLDDGLLKIQFRSFDPNLASEITTMIYVIKNDPSIIRITSPAAILTGTELVGNVIDRRGIKPGCPMIKMWPQNMNEPRGDDPDWGWVTLFLSGIDNIEEGTYAADPPRTGRAVARTANFSFRLSQFTIDPITRQAIYERPFKPLKTGMYRYRIMTQDTFCNDSLLPRAPQAGEVETTGYYPLVNNPDETAKDSGPYFEVRVITSGERPRIALNNDDIRAVNAPLLEEQPNIYLLEDEPAAKKIKKIARGNERDKADDPGKFTDFRLRIVTAHPDGIENATLQWEHAAGPEVRTGYLAWDNDIPGSGGYVNDSNHETRAVEGHRGAWDGALQGTVFRFTAFNDLTYTDTGGKEQIVFSGSTEPYTLTITVNSASKMQAVNKYTLYVNGDGPSIAIRSIRGAAEKPQKDPVNVTGGTFNESAYTVNGGIEAAIDHAASMGFMAHNRVKWFLEEANAAGKTEEALRANPGSLYHKLRNFRENPTAQTLAFFTTITDETGNDNVTISVHRDENGTNRWHKKELWLYVIAQDALHNLGYAVQKLYVDDDSDIPVLNVPGLVSTTTAGAITGEEQLYARKINVLNRNEGIALSCADDDNILPAEMVIRITGHNVNRTADVSAAAMIGSEGALRSWDGMLNQSVIAGALYGTGDGIPAWLEDGIYTLTVAVKDHVPSKVKTGNADPPQREKRLTFLFAVQSELPHIEVLAPRGQNTMQTNVPVPVFGTVRSRLKIQKAAITFTPKLAAGGYNQTEQFDLPLYSDAGHTIAVHDWLVDTNLIAVNGVYTYYWKMENGVNFDPPGLFDGASDDEKFDGRRFELRAWDGLGGAGIAACTVEVDTTPPEVDLLEFNYNRLHIDGTVTVNGKVPIEINAYDLNKIGRDETQARIKWWVLPGGWTDDAGSGIPRFETPFPREPGGNTQTGGGGWFAYGGSDTIYRTIFDVSDRAHYPAGNYHLYVIAEDSAKNRNTAASLQKFIIDPDSDYPALRPEIPLSPADGRIVGTLSAASAVNAIKGAVADDDGFDAAKLDTYIQIRFPQSQSAPGTIWGGWIPVTNNTLNDIGDIEFAFDLNAAIPYNPDYLKTDGEKRYQIRVTDEAAAGLHNVPPGKNPGGGDTIRSVTVTLPGSADEHYYSFFIKNTPPLIFFARHDPPERPVFKDADTLLDALNNGFVRESMLHEVRFIYGSSTDSHLFTPNATDVPVPGTYRCEGDKHIWTIDPAWLGIAHEPEGMHRVTIEATDTLGNLRTQEWPFYKDVTGPAVNFNNISKTAVQTICGEAGKVYISGQFNDSYSPIEDTLSFMFDQQPYAALYDEAINGKTAAWSVPLPGSAYNDPSFPDGKHTFTVKIRDVLGNETTEGPVEFIVDRKPPDMISAARMKVDNVSINRPLDEHERVFSAANVRENDNTAVFTLSGAVYEHNLTQLRASIRNSGGSVAEITLDDIDTWLASTNPDAVYDNGTNDSAGTSGNFRVRKAAVGDFGITTNEDAAHRYVWHLDIRERDVYALLDAAKNLPDQGGERRSVAVTARDTGRADSNREVWNFYLDSEKPAITLSNVRKNARVRLDDRTIALQGSISDATNVKSIQYRIERYDYAQSRWEPVTAGAYGWTYYTDPWGVTYDGYQETQRDSVYFTIGHDAFNDDGLYRFGIMADDWSLAALGSAAGNPNTEYDAVEFYVDRNDPAIQWAWDHDPGAKQKNYYRRDKNNQIVFENIIVSDINNVATVTGELSAYGTATAAAASVAVAVNTGGPALPAPAVTVTVTIGDPAAALANGRYTLRLTATDEAGRAASLNNAFNFHLDNKKPAITIATDSTGGGAATGGLEAITGRVVFRGRFLKDPSLSPIARVACAVRTDYTHNVPVPAAINAATGNALSGDELRAEGWVFNEGRNDNENVLFDNGIPLMEINEGLATANILLYNTRHFSGSSYIGAAQTAAQANAALNGVITFNGVPIADTEIVRPFTVYFLAIDEAGNGAVEQCTYWVYPAGDYPDVNAINNPPKKEIEINRQLNGRIRIAGNAVDNYRVRHVWFRVLKDGCGGAPADTDPAGFEPALNLSIPVWDEFWSAAGGNQTPQPLVTDGKNRGNGWYMANGGGKADVSWWAYINTEGELDPGMGNSRAIIIEVMAEDAYWVDHMNDHNQSANLFSEVNSVKAFVVNGVPRFEDEKALAGKSGEYPVTHPRWGNILTTYVRGRASYSVIVKHDSGIKEIRWTPPGSSSAVNLLEGNYADYTAHLANMDSQEYHPTGNPGIAVKAQPKRLIINSTQQSELGAGRTFMIWEPDDALTLIALEGRANLTGDELQRYTIFTTARDLVPSGIGGAQLLQKTGGTSGAFEWVVIADLNSAILPSNEGIAGVTDYTDRAGYYTLTLSATDISKTIGLAAVKHAAIPIDNIAPQALYTHSTNIAGSSPSFGGEAGDAGSPGGLSRVVLWFSRNIPGVGERSIPWHNNKDDKGNERTYKDFAKGVNPGFALPGGVDMPDILEEGDAGYNSPQWSYIVIDRHDPLGSQTHHGHKRGMGFAATGGDLGMSWYAYLDSTKIESGRVSAHYIVYDRAGNGRYYSQKLMILNGIPRISKITLATDIGVTTGLQSKLGSAASNVTFNESAINANSGALERIRGAFNAAPAAAAPVGISGTIAVDTAKPGGGGVVIDQPYFNIRGKLFALRVETNVGQSSTEKNRHYRVEYVSGAREITGVHNLKDAGGGIRAGRAYIINNPGSTANRFPWGSLGASGQDGNYRRGLAFLAIEDGANIETANVNYGNPSVWELNSAYYQGANPHDPLERTFPSAHLKIDTIMYDKLNDAHGGPAGIAGITGIAADFVYGESAFGASDGLTITDFDPYLDGTGRPLPYPATGETEPWLAHSLFIIKVYDGDEAELFGDFAVLSVRVNNNDATPPYAQLYDLNPKTEGGGVSSITQALATGTAGQMGANRVKGGLYHKEGHIEPRKTTGLTGAEMGGAAGMPSIAHPAAMPGAFFDVDTVSGKVIVRGYAEDDQRVDQIDLVFGARTVTILTGRAAGTVGSDSQFFLTRPDGIDAHQVNYTETADLNRHRVEWAYYWDTENMPYNAAAGDFAVGDITVRVIAHNASANRDRANSSSRERTFDRADGADWDHCNPGYPATSGAMRRYNALPVRLRPYITGFKRNQGGFAHNERSRQGWYMFARGEPVVVTGFNLGYQGAAADSTAIYLPNNAANAATITAPVGSANAGDGGFLVAACNQAHYFSVDANITHNRIFTVDANAITGGDGTVRLSVTRNAVNYWAVNTAAEAGTAAAGSAPGHRPRVSIGGIDRPAVQPWNMERDPGREGSGLWDDFTRAHIWQSDDTNPGADNSRFAATANWVIMNPAMSIDPASGILYASHNEGGSGGGENTGTSRLTDNTNTAASNALNVAQFYDPIIMSDVYRSPGGGGIGAATWTTFSVIGRAGTGNGWNSFGGILVYGPQGRPSYLENGITPPAGQGYYMVESAYYNSNDAFAANNGGVRYTDQFENPHIVTAINNNGAGALEHIHVSYYDAKDGSIKYRYNYRGDTTAINANNDNVRTWINLDGGYDMEDGEGATAVRDYTLLEAANGSDIANRYVREVQVTNNAWVTESTAVYTLGSASRNPDDNTPVAGIRAAKKGIITLHYPQVTLFRQDFANSANAPGANHNNTITSPTGALNANPNWNVGNPAVNRNTWLRAVGAADGDTVAQGQMIYIFGRKNTADNTDVVVITARRAGIINGLQYRVTHIDTQPAGDTARPNVAYAITAGGTTVNFTADNGVWGAREGVTFNNNTGNNRNNYLRNVYVKNGEWIREGEPIYRFTTSANADEVFVYAKNTGFIYGLQYTQTHVGSQWGGGGNASYPDLSYTIVGNYLTRIPSMKSGVYAITYPVGRRVVNAAHRAPINAGRHNAIAVTSAGYPVVAYFDASNQRLKLAVSNSAAPTAANNWVIRDYVIPRTNLSSYGTGQYVSLKIDTVNNADIVHIAALNAVTKQLVYISGQLNPAVQTDDVLTPLPGQQAVTVQVVDSVGDTARWCSLSLDEDGNPWIAYQDEGYRASRDGVKMAYRNQSRFYKGVTQDSGESYFAGKDTDINGGRIDGWEAMHVPTQYRITDARIGMECFPARNVRPNPGVTKNWNAAVSYLAPDYYRIAYYVK